MNSTGQVSGRKAISPVPKQARLQSAIDNRQSVLLAFLLVSTPLLCGFVRSGSNAKWQSLPVPYRINVLGLPSSTNGSEFVAVQKAFDAWQNIATSAIAFSYQGTTDIVSAGTDGTNVISFRDNDYPFSSGTIAVTVSTTSGQSVLDADIVFNPAFSFSTSGKDDAFDVQSIATHEIGHFLGLDHTAIVSATMNPTGSPGSFHARFLKSDDIIGASSLYPTASFTNTTGGLSGRVTHGGSNVFGAHVVALDSQGSPIVSTLSQLDGTYQIVGLPAGNYSVYAEPLDGPVTESDFSGQYDSRVNTDFTTTFLGNTLDFSSRQTVNVAAGSTLPNLNIAVLPAPATALNLTSPGLGVYGPQGVSGSFPAKGSGLATGINFYITGPGISVENATFPSSGNATVSVTISASAPPGLRDLFAQSSDGLSVLTGGFIITGPDPELSSVTPNSGGRAGGTRITLSGSNFVPGTVAYVAGLPLSDLTFVDSNTLQGTTPPNASGNLDILIINPDGTSTVLTGAFISIAPAGTNQFIPFVIDTAQFRTNLGLTNVSAQPAFATLTMYDDTGAVAGSYLAPSVPAGGLIQVNNVIRSIRGTSQVTNSSGSVVINSDQPLVPYATQIDNASNDPSLETGKATGKTQLLIPSTTSVSPFRSSLILQNVGNADATVHLTQRDTAGISQKELTITIPQGGFFQSDDIHATLGLNGVYGPLEITSTNSIPLVATSRVFSPSSAASGFFEGIDLATVTNAAVIPITQDTSSFRTNLGINNIGGMQANVSVSLYGANGTLLGSQNKTVPAHGLLQLNHVNRVLTGASSISNTTGYIRLSSNQPVAGFSSVINNASNDPGLAPSLVSGANRLLVPSATNVNQFRSTLTVINLGNSVSARLRLTVRDTSGNILAQNPSIVIPANGIYNVDDILTNLGISSNYGPLQIESLDSVPLAAVSRVYSISNNTNGFFLAQPF